MTRHLKNRTAFSSTLENELLKQLRELAQESRINMSRLLDEAVTDLLEKHRKNKG